MILYYDVDFETSHVHYTRTSSYSSIGGPPISVSLPANWCRADGDYGSWDSLHNIDDGPYAARDDSGPYTSDYASHFYTYDDTDWEEVYDDTTLFW